jgi:uncharacterized protein YndB with AHSA1/START domain
MNTTAVAPYEFTRTWTFEASPANVFRAWTDPDRLGWFYNDAQPIPTEPIEVDLRVGGVWRQLMVISEQTSYYTGGVYREIVSDEKLAFSWGAVDGWPELDPDRPEDSPLVTVTFSPTGRGTELRLNVKLPEGAARDRLGNFWPHAIQNGWGDTVDRLTGQILIRPPAPPERPSTT